MSMIEEYIVQRIQKVENENELLRTERDCLRNFNERAEGKLELVRQIIQSKIKNDGSGFESIYINVRETEKLIKELWDGEPPTNN